MTAHPAVGRNHVPWVNRLCAVGRKLGRCTRSRGRALGAAAPRARGDPGSQAQSAKEVRVPRRASDRHLAAGSKPPEQREVAVGGLGRGLGRVAGSACGVALGWLRSTTSNWLAPWPSSWSRSEQRWTRRLARTARSSTCARAVTQPQATGDGCQNRTRPPAASQLKEKALGD
jgi:hypothetical protein